MNIVFICGGYYPNYSATGNCIKNIAESFINSGHNVYVICKNDNNLGKHDTYNGQNIIRVNSPYLSYYSSNNKSLLKKIRWHLYFLKTKDGLDSPLINNYLLELEALVSKVTIDAICPCCMPAESLIASLNFKELHPDVRVFPILYDLYSDNRYFFGGSFFRNIKKKRTQSIESRLFDLSSRIYYIDNWNAYFEKNNYPQSLRVEHPLIVYRQKHPKQLKGSNAINIVYQGELNFQNRTPKYFIEFFQQFFIKNREIGVHIFSGGNASEYTASRCDNKNMFFYGYVNKDDADGYFDSSDIAMILCNKEKNIVPSKIFECMAQGLPILYFYNSDEEKAYKLLKRYPLVFFVNQKAFTDNDLFLFYKWIEENYLKRVEFEQVKKEFSDAVPDYIVQSICSTLGE